MRKACIAGEVSTNTTYLILFLLLTVNVVLAAEKSALSAKPPAISEVDFLTAPNGSLPVWLVAGPFASVQDNLETKQSASNIPTEGDKVAANIWSYLNVTDTQVIRLSSVNRNPQGKTFYYAHTNLKLSHSTDTVLVMNSLGRSIFWLDGNRKFITRLDPTSKIQQGVCRVRLKAGMHTLRLRLQTINNRVLFALFAVSPSNSDGFTPITSACISLNLRNWTFARQQQEAAKCLHLSSQPRFVDTDKRLHFTLNLQSGLPLINAPLILKLTGRDSNGKVWINSSSTPTDIADARARGLRIAADVSSNPPWERLLVRADLLSGEKILGSATAPIFCEKNLKLAASKLSNFFENVTDCNSSAAALIRLSMEQVEIFNHDRTRKTLKYGERFFGLIDRARSAAKAFAENRDPLSGLTGIQEGAYISKTDDSVQPYRFYVPKHTGSLPKCKLRPMLVLLHGYVPYYDKLNWMKIDPSMAAAMEELGWFMLLPFGRSNTDFLTIGEDDVLQTISEMQRRYPIDPHRIFLAGFSMGGSGVWTLLSHYPGRFAAAQIWSGRTDYYFWHADDYARAGVSKATIPAWKRWLIDTDNPYDLYRNMSDIPLRVVHPDDDTLVKPGHTRRIYELLKPPHGMMKMVVPPPGDGHWYFSREISKPSTYRWMLRTGPRQLNTIEHTCFTPKYGTKSWLRISAIKEWGKPAHVKATIEFKPKLVLVTKADNVQAISLVPCPALTRVKGFRIILGKDAAVQHEATNWDADTQTLWFSPHAPEANQLVKAAAGVASPNMYGPVKEAFNGPFVLVYGTIGNKKTVRDLSAKAARFQDEWWRFAKGKPRIVRDTDLTPTLIKARNLVLFGSSATNAYVHKIAARLPFGFLSDGYSISNKEIHGENLGMVGIYPNPENPSRYVVIMDGLYYGDSLPINHKWDLVPDYIIFSSATDAYDNTNTAKLAGTFDSFWK